MKQDTLIQVEVWLIKMLASRLTRWLTTLVASKAGCFPSLRLTRCVESLEILVGTV